MAKLASADEVLALVTAAAASNGDVPVDPSMQQLLLQAEAQVQAAEAMKATQNDHHHSTAAAMASSNMMMDPAALVGSSLGGNLVPQSFSESLAHQVNELNAAHASAMDATSVMGHGANVNAAGSGAANTDELMGLAGDQSSDENAASFRRKSIPLSMKQEAIEWIMGPGKGIPSRAEKHFSALNWDVSASSFRKWWKNRDKIMKDGANKKRVSGGGRKPYLEESEEKLLVVIIQERAKKDRVTRKWIAQTAARLFQRTNANFKASENWVTKFIRRHGLSLKRSYVTYEASDHGEPSENTAQVIAQLDAEMAAAIHATTAHEHVHAAAEAAVAAAASSAAAMAANASTAADAAAIVPVGGMEEEKDDSELNRVVV